jgi:hypothetical protein
MTCSECRREARNVVSLRQSETKSESILTEVLGIVLEVSVWDSAHCGESVMRKTLAKLTSAAVASALIFTSSAAIAQSSTPAAAPQAQSSWMALSMLSPVGAGALGGAAAVAQPAPPPPPSAYGRLAPPPLPVIAVWLATLLVMVYIATRNDDHGVPAPNSPA